MNKIGTNETEFVKDERKTHCKDMISRTIVMATLQEHFKAKKKAYIIYKDFDLGELTIEERLRIIRDFVAGMTDSYALNHYRKLSGQRI